jgi:phytoene synthase
LQLTNILRDIDEDAAIGRLYLPRELLSAAGITSDDPAVALASARLDEVCQPLIVRAQKHFGEAEAIMAREPRRTVKTPRIMAAAYQIMLDQIIARGWQPPRAPIKLSKWQFGWILLRYAIV